VSGTRYVIAETNPLNMQHLSLTFSGPTEAQATFQLFDGEFTVPVGLDGRARRSSTGPSGLPMVTKGEWISPREFMLDIDTVANINHFIIHMQFAEREVRLRIDETTGELKGLPLVGRVSP
jgi:hypothetical protein